MKLLRKLSLVVAALCLGLTLAACGGGSDSEDEWYEEEGSERCPEDIKNKDEFPDVPDCE